MKMTFRQNVLPQIDLIYIKCVLKRFFIDLKLQQLKKFLKERKKRLKKQYLIKIAAKQNDNTIDIN